MRTFRGRRPPAAFQALGRDSDEQCTCRSRRHPGLSHRALDDHHHHDISGEYPSTAPRTGSLGEGIHASPSDKSGSGQEVLHDSPATQKPPYEVFAAVEESGHRVRVSTLGPRKLGRHFPETRRRRYQIRGTCRLAGTVVDESGRSWVLDVNTVTNNVIAGSISLRWAFVDTDDRLRHLRVKAPSIIPAENFRIRFLERKSQPAQGHSCELGHSAVDHTGCPCTFQRPDMGNAWPDTKSGPYRLVPPPAIGVGDRQP